MNATPCGARTRSGTPCRQPAMENGRCRMHGGCTPKGPDSPHFVHGHRSRYSDYIKGQLAAKLAAFDEADPLDILPELTMQRVLFADYLSRFESGVQPTAGDIQQMIMWLGDIGRTVERVVKMRNDTALTAVEVKFLTARIADVVAKYVPDPNKQLAFIDECFAGLQTAGPRPIEATATTVNADSK